MKAQGQAVAETGATRAQVPIPVPSPSWFPRDGSRGSGGRADQARVGPALTPAGRGGAAREPSPASLVIPSACPPFPSGTLSTLRAPAGGRQVGWAVGVPGKAVLRADTSLPLPLTAGGALAVPPGGTPSAGSLQVLAVNRPVCSPAWGWDPTSPGCSPSPPARALRRPRPVGGLPEAAQPGGSLRWTHPSPGMGKGSPCPAFLKPAIRPQGSDLLQPGDQAPTPTPLPGDQAPTPTPPPCPPRGATEGAGAESHVY